MDAGETVGESVDSISSPLASPRHKFEDLTPPVSPSALSFSDAHRRRAYRQSTREHPSTDSGKRKDGLTSPPVSNEAQRPVSPPHSRGLAMSSFFNLFSKPKVEKARGYTETGLDSPPTLPLPTVADASHPDVALRGGPGHAVDSEKSGPIGAMASSPSKSLPPLRVRPDRPSPAAGSASRKAPFEPPPLFQAFPQAVAQGILEVSNVAAETILQKSRDRNVVGGTGQLPLTHQRQADGGLMDVYSTDGRRNARTTLKYVANGAVAHVETPRKIVLLVTSGYLLQYAEKGPSNRLPEKVLQLGKTSAAFACDLVPGKHFVLQVSSSVDQQATAGTGSGSFLSRFGIRSAATRRTTSHLLLVFPTARELDTWMVLIRKEIEAMGGKSVRPDSTVRPKTRDAPIPGSFDDLLQTPAHSQRYQVARQEPNKIANPSPPHSVASRARTPLSRLEQEIEESDTATLDGIEEEAAQINADSVDSPKQSFQDNETQSVMSSTTVSTDQQRLESLRGSVRTSHTTGATTFTTSRTNSLTDSPPSERTRKDGPDLVEESGPSRSPYRSLSSYNVARRSVAPGPRGDTAVLSRLEFSKYEPQSPTMNAAAESPITGRNPPLSAARPARREIGVAVSEPDLRGAARSFRTGLDFKMSKPPVLSEEPERPESFLADLPPPATWASNPPSNKRPVNDSLSRRLSMQPAPRAESRKVSRRLSAQPFNLPLRINPSASMSTTTVSLPSAPRSSFNAVDEAGEEPTVHTLSAKVVEPRHGPSPRMASSTRPAQQDMWTRQPSHTSSPRLSLFPSQMSASTTAAPEPGAARIIKRSPSETALSSEAQQQQKQQSAAHVLRRPTSMQIRSNYAPGVQSVRTTTKTPPVPTTRSFTAPIRSLKPSRSSRHILPPVTNPPAPIHQQQAYSTPPSSSPTATRFDSTSPRPHQIRDSSEEASDTPTPLPHGNAFSSAVSSPLPSRPSSRSTTRKPRTRTSTSLPELDLGLPVVGLGPPAPPPEAPLPAPPQLGGSSRAASPAFGTRTGTADGGYVASGLGIHA